MAEVTDLQSFVQMNQVEQFIRARDLKVGVLFKSNFFADQENYKPSEGCCLRSWYLAPDLREDYPNIQSIIALFCIASLLAVPNIGNPQFA